MESAERICGFCGKELVRTQKRFCSRACRNRFYLHPGREQPHIERVCQTCGAKFLATRPTRKFCGDQCKNKSSWAKKLTRMGGRKPRPDQTFWRNQRPQVLARQDGCCWLCGERIDGAYDVHHLDGDKNPRSELLGAFHPGCHNRMHKVSILFDGSTLRLEGSALDVLKRRGLKWNLDTLR